MGNNILELSARELAKKVQSRELKSTEIVNEYLKRIEKYEPKVKAFVTVLKDSALEQAELVDKKVEKGEKVGSLSGVPIAIKDNIQIDGFPTTCSSKILEKFKAPYDATVTEKLKASDAVFVGKTNLDEFAMGSSTENSAFFTTKNPWNTLHICGGSSGGSAASVSAGMAPISIGSDTGGSIRQPASCCGVIGMKPTYGSVSRYGLVAFASSLDQIGPFARNIEDTSLLLQIISGYDSKDSTSVNRKVPDYPSLIKKDIKGLKIGIPKEYFIEGLSKEVEKSVKEAIKVLEGQGAVVKEISLPNTKYAVAVYYILATSEASANLARYDGVRYGFRAKAENLLEAYEKSRGQGFGEEVKRRIMLGTYALSAGYYDAYYGKAQSVRTLVKEDFEKAFEKVDLIVTPTSPTPAFKIGEKTSDPLQMYLSDIFTISCNLAGLPGISIPCGFSSEKLPIGLQMIGNFFKEEDILRAGYHYQKNTDWHSERPEIV
ncbi:Asp-tRNA(Asn)/Glu-tRNA(Gln) amidotransferase subunit GatA [Elusimicrobiota bacterium]